MISRMTTARRPQQRYDHRLRELAADFQMCQLGVPGAGGVERHEQDAVERSARRMDELHDFFLTQNHRQVARSFRIRRIADAPGALECLDVKKAQRRQTLSYGVRRQLALLEQFGLIFTNVSKAQAIGGTVESSSKIFDCADVAAYGILRVMTTLSFRAVRPAEPHEIKASSNQRSTTSREASAAGRLRPNGISLTRPAAVKRFLHLFCLFESFALLHRAHPCACEGAPFR